MDTITKKNSINKSVSKSNDQTCKYTRRHVVIPEEDLRWKRSQKSAVKDLFDDCWLSDPYGSRWVQLNTSLKRSSFAQARKVLEARGLFIFKPDKSIGDGRETVCWLVQNLHGSRVKSYWEKSDFSKIESMSVDFKPEEKSAAMDFVDRNVDKTTTKMEIESTVMDCISPQTLTEQGFQNASSTSQELFSNSSQELLEREEEKPQANAPLGGAMPEQEEREYEKPILKPKDAAPIEKEKPQLKEKDIPEQPAIPSTIDLELEPHLEAAERGVKPSDEVFSRLLAHEGYAPSFRTFAHRHGWELPGSAPIPDNAYLMIQQIKERQRQQKMERRQRFKI